MQKFDAETLLAKYRSGKCTPEEEALVEHYILNVGVFPQDIPDIEDDLDEVQLKVASIPVEPKTTNWPLQILKVAAVVTIIAAGATLFFKKDSSLPNGYANDIDPGTNKAMLILANGTSINLSDAKNGSLANDSGVEIIKTADGQLTYKFTPNAVKTVVPTKRDSVPSLLATTTPVADVLHLNSLKVPRGGQYHIALPDGTNVWVNAGSTLKFPSSFWDMPERRVYLTGEAYFEVRQIKSLFGMQKRARKVPFIVETQNKQEVTVLGTHFNINSYADEPNIKTTLLEGLVKVSTFAGGDAILKPGMQSVTDGSTLNVAKVNTEESIAWKNGEFMFRNETLESIMRRVSRWYDIEVVYENKDVAKELFGGTISRYDKISKVLCSMEGTGDVKFRVSGKKVTITK